MKTWQGNHRLFWQHYLPQIMLETPRCERASEHRWYWFTSIAWSAAGTGEQQVLNMEWRSPGEINRLSQERCSSTNSDKNDSEETRDRGPRMLRGAGVFRWSCLAAGALGLALSLCLYVSLVSFLSSWCLSVSTIPYQPPEHIVSAMSCVSQMKREHDNPVDQKACHWHPRFASSPIAVFASILAMP